MDPFSLSLNLSLSGGPLLSSPTTPDLTHNPDAYRLHQHPGKDQRPYLHPHSSASTPAQSYFVNPYDVVLGIGSGRRPVPPPPPPPAPFPEQGAPTPLQESHESLAVDAWPGRFPSRSLPPPLSTPSRSGHAAVPTSPRRHAVGTSPTSPRPDPLQKYTFAPLGPSPPPFHPMAANMMIRSYSAPAGSVARCPLPPFANLASQLLTARRPFSGTEVPLPDVAANLESILENRRVHEEAQQRYSRETLHQLSRQRKELEARLAIDSPGDRSASVRASDRERGTISTRLIDERRREIAASRASATMGSAPAPGASMGASHAAHTGSDTALYSSCYPSPGSRSGSSSASRSAAGSPSANKLFPRRLHLKGRYASKPPAFKDGDPVHMRPRTQSEKFAGDLYTPAIVRAGKSSGKGEAAGGIGTKEAWCGLCEPHQVAATGNGNSLIGGWLNLRNSSYRYHMIRAHGISPRTYRPFKEPVQTLKRIPGVDGKVAEGAELKGLCHQCNNWITFSQHEATNFWVHAAKCHREVFVDPRDLQNIEVTPTLPRSPPKSHRSRDASGDNKAGQKRKALSVLDDNQGREHKRKRHTRTNTGCQKSEPDVDDEAMLASASGNDDVSAAPRREPAWSISRSGRIIKLRDSHWTHDA
ncbi:unnamed protein product [Parajaminaea phylloscopi]